jgi:putative membrane protein
VRGARPPTDTSIGDDVAMLIVGLVLVGLAALLHVYIFWLESFAWTSARGRATFGTTVEEARATRELAYNQGFYNLFLALVAGAGVVLVAVDETVVGATMAFVGAGSMLAAAAVLLLSSPDKARAAITQGALPLLGVVALALGLA